MLETYIGAAVVIGGLYYMIQALNETVEVPPGEVDMVTQPLDPKDLIDETTRNSSDPKDNHLVIEGKNPQAQLNAELIKLRRDYSTTLHTPYRYGNDGPLAGLTPVYRGDYRDYDPVNREP